MQSSPDQEKGTDALDVRDNHAQGSGHYTPKHGGPDRRGYQDEPHSQGIADELYKGIHRPPTG
jgi:hypothetical protein